MAGILQVLSTGEVDEHFVAVMHIDMLLQSCTPWCDTRKDAGHAVPTRIYSLSSFCWS